MKLARRLALIVLAAAAAVALAGTSARSAPQAAKPKLTSFGTCGQLLGYAKGQAKRFVGPYGYGTIGRPLPTEALPPVARAATPAAPVQGVDFSGTNVQEEGVDEPDLVKTDGNTVFAVANGKLRAVDVAGAKPRLLDSLALEPGLSHELLLHGDRLLVLSRGGYWIEPLPALAARIAPYQPSNSVLAEIDVSDPAKLRLVRTLTLDGSYVAARLVGSAARIVVGRPAARRAPVQAAHRRLARGDRHREAPERGRARALEGRKLAPVLPDQARGREARQGAPARPVPPRAPPDGVLRARHAHRPHRRPDEGPAARRLGRGDDGRPDRLRVAGEPLRHHRALGRPAGSGQADRGAGRSADRDPQVRHLEPDEDAVPRQRQGLGLPAQPVVALRVPRRAPRRQHREPGVVGLGRGDRVVPDHAASVRRQSRPGGPGRRPRQGRARLLRALRRRHRLRRHLPPGRSALHARPLAARAARACSAS